MRNADQQGRPVFCWLLLLLIAALSGAGHTAERSVNNGQLILHDVPEIPDSLMARLRQYQSVRSAGFLDWDEKGEGLYIRTRFAEVGQLHYLNGPGGSRRQLTWFENLVGQVERRPGRRELALTLDRDGGEFDQIYLFDPKTATRTLLTDGQSRNRLFRWSENGKLLAYQSTRRSGRSNDIWMLRPEQPDQAELLLQSENGDWWAPADFSRDGKLLLLQQMVDISDSRIHVMDLATREIRLLAGSAEFPSANRATALDADARGFYFITNQRGRSAELAWRSLEPEAEIEFITSQIPRDVSAFELSDDGRRGAFVTNEDGVSRLYLLDTRSRRYSQVRTLPLGVIYTMKFHPDNRHLALTLNTAQTPSDVFVLELGRSAKSAKSLKRWTYSEVGGLDTASFVEPELIYYPTFDLRGEMPREVPAFVYRPKSKGPHPVIILIHGGPEAQYRPSFSSEVQMWVAELGSAVIAPNIRGSTGYDSEYLGLDDGMLREDAVKDIGTLLDWIALQPDLDHNRVAVYGSSYGGYVALASAVHFSDRLRAGVDLVGISNFVSFLENTEDYRRELRRREYGDERDPEMRAFLQAISPLNNVQRIQIPLLVVQGQNDPRVPVSESEQIVNALRDNNQPVWYINALNEGHGYNRKENNDVLQQTTVMFLQRYLVE